MFHSKSIAPVLSCIIAFLALAMLIVIKPVAAQENTAANDGQSNVTIDENGYFSYGDGLAKANSTSSVPEDTAIGTAPLEISVDCDDYIGGSAFNSDDSGMQVDRNGNGQTYNPGDFLDPTPGSLGIFVNYGACSFGPDLDAANNHSDWTCDNEGSSGTGTPSDPYIATLNYTEESTGLLGDSSCTNDDPTTAGSELTFDQTITYVNGQDFFQMDWTVCGGAAGEEFTTYLAADFFLGTSDSGYGFFDAASGSVGTYQTAPNQQYMYFTPISPNPATSHYSDGWPDIWDNIGEEDAPGPGFSNEVNPALHDSAGGLQWDATFGADGCATFSSYLTFSDEFTVPGPFTINKAVNDSAPAVGDTISYTISVENTTGETDTVDITDAFPAGVTPNMCIEQGTEEFTEVFNGADCNGDGDSADTVNLADDSSATLNCTIDTSSLIAGSVVNEYSIEFDYESIQCSGFGCASTGGNELTPVDITSPDSNMVSKPTNVTDGNPGNFTFTYANQADLAGSQANGSWSFLLQEDGCILCGDGHDVDESSFVFTITGVRPIPPTTIDVSGGTLSTSRTVPPGGSLTYVCDAVVEPVPLVVDKTASQTPIAAGDLVSYTIVVSNPATATVPIENVQLSDPMYAPLACTPALTTTNITLNPGDSQVYTCPAIAISADVTNTATATGDGSIVNTAAASNAEFDRTGFAPILIPAEGEDDAFVDVQEPSAVDMNSTSINNSSVMLFVVILMASILTVASVVWSRRYNNR